MDLQSLEILDLDSSSQEESSSDRLEAAVSLSNLSVGLQQAQITLNTQNTSRVLSSTSNRGIESGMLVIMSTQGFQDHGEGQEENEEQLSVSLPPLLSQPSLEQESTRSIDLDSSMESEESSRQLESLQSMLLENDPSSDQNVTVITSLPRTQEQDQQQQTQDVVSDSSSTIPNSQDSDSNGAARSRLRERDGSSRSIPTGTYMCMYGHTL